MSNTEDQNIEGTKVHLITWNPELWPDLTDELIDATIKVLHAGSRIIDQWSVGNRKNDIESGDSVFLLRQGNDRRGIIAKGVVLGEIFQGPHWDSSKSEANYVEYLLESHVTVDHRLPIADLETHINPSSGKSFEINWSQIYGSGRTLSDDDGESLLELWDEHLETLI